MVDDEHVDNDVDYDPNPVYLDEDSDGGADRAAKRIKHDDLYDLLPRLRGERVGPVRTFISANEDGEGIEIPVDEEKQWYVIHCYSGYENKVRHAIDQRIETMGMQDKIFDVVVPTEEEIEEIGRERVSIPRTVLSRIMFAPLKMDEDSWY